MLTLRDVRVLRDCLLATDDWHAAAHAYAQQHDRYYGALHRRFVPHDGAGSALPAGGDVQAPNEPTAMTYICWQMNLYSTWAPGFECCSRTASGGCSSLAHIGVDARFNIRLPEPRHGSARADEATLASLIESNDRLQRRSRRLNVRPMARANGGSWPDTVRLNG